MIGFHILIEKHKSMTGLVIMIIVMRGCEFGMLLLNFLTSLQEIMMNVVDVLSLLQLFDLLFKCRLNIIVSVIKDIYTIKNKIKVF